MVCLSEGMTLTNRTNQMRLFTTSSVAIAAGFLLTCSNSAYAQTQVGCMASGDAIVELPSGKLLKLYGERGPILGDHVAKFVTFDGATMPDSRSDEYGTCTVIYK